MNSLMSRGNLRHKICQTVFENEIKKMLQIQRILRLLLGFETEI
jgi:hypothetical protein